MKSRDLNTIHDLIVRDYTITKLPSGKYLHQFKPSTTETVYEFEANSAAVIKDGDRYNVGFRITPDNRRVVEQSALAKVDQVNTTLSYLAAQKFSSDKREENKGKNDQRVVHKAATYHWGKKYAWREYGLVISKDAFYAYLEEIRHPSVPCVTSNPDLPYAANENSTAYSDKGLQVAMDNLIETAVKTGRYFKSPRYSRQFQIRAINAITDKK